MSMPPALPYNCIGSDCDLSQMPILEGIIGAFAIVTIIWLLATWLTKDRGK